MLLSCDDVTLLVPAHADVQTLLWLARQEAGPKVINWPPLGSVGKTGVPGCTKRHLNAMI